MDRLLPVDPATYSRLDAWNLAVDHCEAFLRANGLSVPAMVPLCADRGLNGCYERDERRANVDVAKSRLPSTSGYAWSWTGYKADLTAPGILAHEVGHHIDFELRLAGSRSMIDCLDEPCISSYDESFELPYRRALSERYAESVKLFVLNPDLLRSGRPLRYRALSMFLRPTVTLAWREVLCNSPRHLRAAEGWIARKI